MDNADWRWINSGLANLAAKRDPLRRELLATGRLRLSFSDNTLDQIDLCSATLTSAAIDRGQSTLFVLPDGRSRRPPFLLAYALLNVWWRDRAISTRPRVLYCGASPGIREQLAKLKVSSVRLDSVFDQIDLPRHRHALRLNGAPVDAQLPRVVTAYAPADAKALVAAVRPRFIAVDFDDAGQLPWLADLLEAAQDHKTTVIAWGTNPLSEAVQAFSSFGHVVRWPFGRGQGGDADYPPDEQLEVLLQPFAVTQVHPLLAGRPSDVSYSAALAGASAKLRAIMSRGVRGYSETALQYHWRLYRDIEGLHVPLGLFEAEAAGFWGISRLSRTLAICKRFQEILASRDPQTASDLSCATDALSDAIEWLSHNDPPLWRALGHLVQTPPKSGQGRLITFQSRAKKALFLFALLVKLNLTEDDLRPLGNWVATLDDLRHNAEEFGTLIETGGSSLAPKDLVFVPTLVGLPSMRIDQRLWPLFLADDLVLLTPTSQHRAISGRVRRWSDALSADLPGLCRTIADLFPASRPTSTPAVSDRVELSAATIVGVEDQPIGEIETNDHGPLWNGSEIEDELSWLFARETDEDAMERAATDEEASPDDADPWIGQAIELTFTDGWRGTFEPTAKLNFIDRTAGELDERYVRSLRVGDPVLLIPFQRRQGLYDLIVGRVHRHPAMQLHLALLARWHSDLIRGFQSWSRPTGGAVGGDRSPDALLQELRARGSELSSALAVRFWITGVTLCPHDPEDIRRVAEILGLEFTATQYRKIGLVS